MSENFPTPPGEHHPLPAPQPQPSLPPSPPKTKSLTTLMIANISILAIVGVASILVMLFGNFDGKGIRVASTFLVFGAFTAFTALDASDKKPSWHLPIGQVGNIYMLALSLVQIWATLSVYRRYDGGLSILGNVVMIIFVVKLGTVIVQKITDLVFHHEKILSSAAIVSALSFAAATVLYTLPSGVGWIEGFTFGDGYWRFSTAVLLLAGLSLAITVLLGWFYGVFAKKARPAAPAVIQHNAPHMAPPVPSAQPVVQHTVPANNPVPSGTSTVPASLPADVPEFAVPVRATLSWPVFPSGLPLPAKPNGRPDFGALREIAKVYDDAERQWFGQ